MQEISGRLQRHLPRIAVDVMGLDFGPKEMLSGVCSALQTDGHRFEKIYLVGNATVLTPLLDHYGFSNFSVVEFVHAPQVIEMQEKPIYTLKHKKDASMFRAIDLVKNGTADAILSCGNTGSLMAGGTLKLGPIAGVERPALASIIPTRQQRFILIDVGANPSSTAKHLVHNAILGSHYARAILERTNPRIGLLTIGTEEGKGNEIVHTAHSILKNLPLPNFNYQGLIEGFHLFNDTVDVVVCDGFVGNILLKTCESLFYHLKEYLKEELQKNYMRKMGAFLSQGVFLNMKKQFSPEHFSGAPLLGLNGWVFKSHGSSREKSIAGALRTCLRCLEVYDLKDIQNDIASTNLMIEKLKENE
ncbi:MAG: phosphate acyltransferase PlsX [Puniceicoccales bacterium]|jgi:glycerol-3-phosphate acyltransferase PlsX|nr:phosphate acyltransferase PlsX [Puniceicoccales bacterium]